MSPEKTPEPSNTPENFQADSEAIFQPGQRVIVERTDGRTEYDWVVVANNIRVSPDTGKDVEVVLVQKADGSATKEVMTSKLVEIKERFDRKLDMDLGELAVEQSMSELVDFEQAPLEKTPEQIAITTLEQEIDDIRNSLSDDDKTAVWRYATAITENEISRALGNMSPEVRVTGIYQTYADKFQELRQLKLDQN